MFCKIVIEVTKTIADVLQVLYRRLKDNRRCIARKFIGKPTKKKKRRKKNPAKKSQLENPTWKPTRKPISVKRQPLQTVACFYALSSNKSRSNLLGFCLASFITSLYRSFGFKRFSLLSIRYEFFRPFANLAFRKKANEANFTI